MITSINRAIAKRSDEHEKGFTLIELLVVILIIGILAAIAIPVFLGQQNQAKDGAAKSDLGNAKLAMVSAATAANGTYPAAGDSTATALALSEYGYANSITGTTGIPVFIDSSDGAGDFCLEATSDAGNPFYIEETGGVKDGSCPAA